jgi:hypothetical protein
VHFAVRLNPAQFAGPHNMLLEMVDTDKHASPAPVYGNWTVPGRIRSDGVRLASGSKLPRGDASSSVGRLHIISGELFGRQWNLV